MMRMAEEGYSSRTSGGGQAPANLIVVDVNVHRESNWSGRAGDFSAAMQIITLK